MLSGRGLCDGLITRPEGSYRLWCVVVCNLETSSRMSRPWPALDCSAIGEYIYIYIYIYIYGNMNFSVQLDNEVPQIMYKIFPYRAITKSLTTNEYLTSYLTKALVKSTCV